MLLAALGSVRIGKNCDLGLENAARVVPSLVVYLYLWFHLTLHALFGWVGG